MAGSRMTCFISVRVGDDRKHSRKRRLTRISVFIEAFCRKVWYNAVNNEGRKERERVAEQKMREGVQQRDPRDVGR